MKMLQESEFANNDPISVIKEQFPHIYKIILEWADLSGIGKKLGHGYYGVAYEANGLAIKFTQDELEAKSASTIIRKELPNVYHIYQVGKLWYRPLMEAISRNTEDPVYIILTSLLEEASFDAEQVADSFNPDLVEHINDVYITPKYEKFYMLIKTFQKMFKNKELELMKRYYKGEYNVVAFVLVMASFLGFPLDIEEFANFLPEELAVEDFEETKTFNLAHNMLNTDVTEEQIRFFWDILSGIKALKDAGVYFSDVHSGNIAFNNDGELELIDIGVSRAKGQPQIDDIRVRD